MLDVRPLQFVLFRFFASEQCKTGKPIEGTLMKELPLELDMEVTLEDPFLVNAWVKEHKKEINEKGKLKVFDRNYQFQVGGNPLNSRL